MNKDYEWLRLTLASYIDADPKDGGSLLEYASALGKKLYRQGADSPASSIMIDLAAYIENECSQAIRRGGKE